MRDVRKPEILYVNTFKRANVLILKDKEVREASFYKNLQLINGKQILSCLQVRIFFGQNALKQTLLVSAVVSVSIDPLHLVENWVTCLLTPYCYELPRSFCCDKVNTSLSVIKISSGRRRFVVTFSGMFYPIRSKLLGNSPRGCILSLFFYFCNYQQDLFSLFVVEEFSIQEKALLEIRSLTTSKGICLLGRKCCREQKQVIRRVI